MQQIYSTTGDSFAGGDCRTLLYLYFMSWAIIRQYIKLVWCLDDLVVRCGSDVQDYPTIIHRVSMNTNTPTAFVVEGPIMPSRPLRRASMEERSRGLP